MIEVWRPIARTFGAYEVSDHGRVRRAPDSPPCSGTWPGHVLRPHLDTHGYLRVELWQRGRFVRASSVHRLVALAFLGAAPGPRYQVNHRNGRKRDNRAANLEWVTPAQNVQHAIAHGLWKRLKLCEADVRFIRDPACVLSTALLAALYGVHPETIRDVRRRDTWAHVV